MNIQNLVLIIVAVTAETPLPAQTVLKYVPAPVDNPLKGLVPYAGPHANRFPHSLEYQDLPLSVLVKGADEFEWQPLEDILNDISSRRHQAILRIWMEYPGRSEGIPEFLEVGGLKVTEWLNTNTDPFPRQQVRTPDYSDPALRSVLQSFLAAFGRRYDGDPRIGFITAGLLGTWGEWHTYPRTELMADKTVQSEVMTAYEGAFKVTPVLLRYPAGSDAWAYAANHDRRFGYHDDSFAWATLETGRQEDNWFFVPALKAAGTQAVQKWKSFPVGGEIRPELWGQIFDDQPVHPQAQDFAECVRQTHASWLLDTGMFGERQSDARIKNAMAQVRAMGYEFHVEACRIQPDVADLKKASADVSVFIQVRNTGVAPFYYDWAVELGTVHDKQIQQTWPVEGSLLNLLPDSPLRTWTARISKSDLPAPPDALAIRIVNPLPNGMPPRFANEPSPEAPEGWLLLPAR
ncbi:MAG: hypothetical protein R3C49_02325 [Planctomycetaceae bacterium]